MSAVLNILFVWSLSGAAVILVLAAVSRLLGRYLGRRWQYYVWLLAVARLLLPVPAPAGFSLMPVQYLAGDASLMPVQYLAGDASPMAAHHQADAVPPSGQHPADPTLLPAQELDSHRLSEGQTSREGYFAENLAKTENSLDEAAHTAAFSTLLMFLWLTAAAAAMGKRVWDYRLALKKLAAVSTKVRQPGPAFEKAMTDSGLKRRPSVFLSGGISSPLTVGVFCPVILLPPDFPEEQAYYVFLHEMIHIRRMDALYKWAVEAVVCLHWFNPAVYILRRETARVCELSCDEAAICRMDRGELRLYGNTLLTTLQGHIAPKTAGMTLPLGENARWMRERLEAIMKFRKRSRSSVVLAVVLTAILASSTLLCGFTLPQRSNSTRTADSEKSAKSADDTETADDASDGAASSWDEEDVIRRADQKGSYTRMDWLNGYFLTLAWNVDSGKYETVRRIDGKKVCFTEKTKPYADDSAVLGAIRLFIEKQIEESGSFPPEEMVFLGVDGPFSDTADELIGRFYNERNEAYFSVMSEYAGAETCARIMDRAYEEGQETFFAILADLPELARKKREIADKAAKNGDIEFFSIASDGMSDGELSRYAQAAYDSDNFELFVLTCQGLDEAQAAAIEEQAYADGRFEYLFALEE